MMMRLKLPFYYGRDIERRKKKKKFKINKIETKIKEKRNEW